MYRNAVAIQNVTAPGDPALRDPALSS